jgi:hypothetical protein
VGDGDVVVMVGMQTTTSQATVYPLFLSGHSTMLCAVVGGISSV